MMFDFFSQFLQDIFDALFAILNEGAEQYGNLVFQALVSTYYYIYSNNLRAHLGSSSPFAWELSW